jgi:hypothetical protein
MEFMYKFQNEFWHEDLNSCYKTICCNDQCMSHKLFWLQLKKIFAQVIIAMAHHGYLELEGGHQMIEFIVKQCSLPNDPPVSMLCSLSNDQSRRQTFNVLNFQSWSGRFKIFLRFIIIKTILVYKCLESFLSCSFGQTVWERMQNQVLVFKWNTVFVLYNNGNSGQCQQIFLGELQVCNYSTHVRCKKFHLRVKNYSLPRGL